LKRLLIYSAVLVIAPLLLGLSLSFTSWLVGLSLGYAKHIPIFGVGMLKVLPVIFTTLAFALLYRLMPNRYVSIRHALIGAVCAAVLFETMSRVFGYYISHFPTYKLVYGAFASIPIFLMWIYASWLTILAGAVISASLPHWRTPQTPHLPPVVLMLDALRVLEIMSAQPRSGSIKDHELSARLHLGYEPIEAILERLEEAGIVGKTEGDRWLLLADPTKTRATELLHLFVLDRSSLFAEQGDDLLQRWLAGCAAQLEHSTDITLHDLFTKKVV
jgi:membrane protein